MERSTVDNEIRDRSAGRHEAANDAGANPAAPRDRAQPDPATAPATRPTEVTPTSAGFRVRSCKWCNQVDLRGPRRETDVIAIIAIGKKVLASWNAQPIIVQDGICESCASKLKDGHVIDGSTTL
jgi:hypothetical protein